MFPGAHAIVHYNEAGEPLGWDYPSDEPAGFDEYDDANNPERPFKCKCGGQVWVDDEDEILAHNEVCEDPEWFQKQFLDIEFPEEDE